MDRLEASSLTIRDITSGLVSEKNCAWMSLTNTDTNNIIIVYPQATTDYTPHTIWSGTTLSNPNACFDWVGWYGTNADQKGGKS